jgi:hypothetical protein
MFLLANIGESMLKANPCRDFQNDVKCLGRLLQRMLEPESAFADHQALKLLRQDRDVSAADFLKQAHSEPAAVLLQVSIEDTSSRQSLFPNSINSCGSPRAKTNSYHM